MTTPVMLVFSRDHDLVADLPSALQGRAEIRACDSTDELLDLSATLRPQAVFADLRKLPGNFAAETVALESLRERFPAARFAVLMPDECPASVFDWIATHGIAPWKGTIERSALLHAVRDLILTEREPPPANPDNHPPAVLMGISRRFETFSPHLKQMLSDLEVAARHDVTTLLIGETGAGKTYLARLIHEVSPRRHEPFITVACGALPADLIESELFGHMKGAFTSAHADKEGKFIAARRGSVLLDEIDVLGPEQQVKLLRVIETGEFEPVGSNHTQHCQARLIVASNLDLQPLVEQGRFRPDLYYRLNMLKFTIPPLRQRKVDIIPLAQKFIRQFAQKHQVRIDEVDPGLLDALVTYPWPGNVRELEHVVQRAVIYCRDGVLYPQHLPPHILSGSAGPVSDPTVILPGHLPLERPSERSLGGQIALTEKEIIEQTLFKNSFSRTKTAKELGISRVTLYNKMKRYGLSR
jgi:DNA-binding NtrC family response regulator